MNGLGRRVAITGYGVVAPCGLDKESFWSGLLGPGLAGVDRATVIESWDSTPYYSSPKEARRADLSEQFAIAAATEAMEQAGDLGLDPARIGTIFATAIAGPFAFLKTYLLQVEFGSMGLFFTAYSLGAIAVRLGLGWLPDRAGPKRVLAPFLALLGLGLAGIGLAGGDVTFGLVGALCGMGHGMTNPILNGLVITRARPAERGAAIALYTAVFDAGALLGGPLFGAISRDVGYAQMFVSAGAVVAVGGLVFAVWDRGR